MLHCGDDERPIAEEGGTCSGSALAIGWGAGLEICEVGQRVTTTSGGIGADVRSRVRVRMIWVPTTEVVLAMMKRY